MSVKSVFEQAVKCDRAGRIFEAQHLYEVGIHLLLTLIKSKEVLEEDHMLKDRVEEYSTRAEILRTRVKMQMDNSVLDNYTVIPKGLLGVDYEAVLGKYTNDSIHEVILEEPKLNKFEHFKNLSALIEFFMKQCPKFKFIEVATRPRYHPFGDEQNEVFDKMQTDLKALGVTMSIRFDNDVSDTKLIFQNGYIIRLESPGLHFFSSQDIQNELGQTDLVYRVAKSVVMDVFRIRSLLW